MKLPHLPISKICVIVSAEVRRCGLGDTKMNKNEVDLMKRNVSFMTLCPAGCQCRVLFIFFVFISVLVCGNLCLNAQTKTLHTAEGFASVVPEEYLQDGWDNPLHQEKLEYIVEKHRGK